MAHGEGNVDGQGTSPNMALSLILRILPLEYTSPLNLPPLGTIKYGWK